MIILEYTRTGMSCSDFYLEDDFTSILNYISIWKDRGEVNLKLKFSTSNIFYRVLVGIARGEIDYTQVIFKYNEHNITINKYGALSSYPKGFLDIEIVMGQEVLEAAVKLRKEEINRIFV